MALVEDTLTLTDDLEARFTSGLEAALDAAMTEATSNIRQTHLAGALPASFRKELVQRLSAIWLATTGGFVALMLTNFADGFKEIKADSSVLVEGIVNKYVQQFGAQRASQIIRTTEIQVRSMVLGGMLLGEAQESIFSNIINKIPAIAEVRAKLITRTEVHSASQFAAQQMAAQSGIRLKKTWNTTLDERTRAFGLFSRKDAFDHRVMNGRTIDLDQNFLVPTRAGGFEPLMFPGHPNGSAGNVINCRCVQTFEKESRG